MMYLSQFLQKYPELDVNQNVQPVILKPQFNSQPPKQYESSKLFEEQIQSHECKLIQDFIDKVYISGINLQNLQIYSNQLNNLEPFYNKSKHNLTTDYQAKWNVIKDELRIARQIQDWIRKGEEQMQNYSIPCNYTECKQQLIAHCSYFTNELNLKQANPILTKELVSGYDQCIDDVKKWKIALEKASRIWQLYESSKQKLMNWLKDADDLLLRSHEPKLEKQIRRNHLENLKNFFSNRDADEKILKEFIVACEDVLSTLPEENKPELRSTLTGLMNRFYKIINYSAPQHLIKFEFDFIECDFFDKVRSLQKLPTKQEQLKCESSISNDLVELENLSTNYWNSFNDKTLLDKAIGHRKEWEKYKKRLDDNLNIISQTTANLQNLVKEAEYGVNLAKNNNLKSDILQQNESLFKKIHFKLSDLQNLEKSNQLGIGDDLKKIESQIDRLLLDLNLVIEDKILNWCKVKDRSRLPSPTLADDASQNNQKFLIQKIDFYSKLVNEFEKYEGLIGRSKELIDELNLKLDELARRPVNKSIDEIAINYKECSNTIELTINRILEELRDINNKLRDHNYCEELHANEILNELKRLRQRNEEQYNYLIENFSKDLLKQIETYRSKCEHCKEIADLRNLLLEVRNLNTTSVHKLEHLNLGDALLNNKLLSNLEDLIKLIDEKCNRLMGGLKEEEKRVRITTELTQKKIIEEIDGRGERSSSQISEYNFKDLSNVNPFYASSNTSNIQTTNTQSNKSNNLLTKPDQSDFCQQFNLSQENLKHATTNLKKEEDSVQQQATTCPKLIPEVKQEGQAKKEDYEIEAEKEKERIETEYKKEQERIENELKKERERLEEQAKEQRLKMEANARKERERIEEEMRKEKERLELQRQFEKDNELIQNLNKLLDKELDLVDSNEPEKATIDEFSNCLINLKQLCIQAKYIKDTQLNDKDKINEFENKLNETCCKLLALIESKIADDLGKDNFDLDNNLDIVNLDENINRTEAGFNLITSYLQCERAFNEIANWINETKDRINLLPYETIENLLEQYKQFKLNFDKERTKLEETSDKLNSNLNYANIIKTPYLDSLEGLKTDYTDKCKEIFDDFSNELKDKVLDIEQKAKECDSFNDFKRINKELTKLRNEPILSKIKEEPNLAIVSELSKIDNQLDELSRKLENILDDKAIEASTL